MTQEEKNEVCKYLDEIFRRINTAKSHMTNYNYGLAFDELAKAYPELKLKVD